MGYEPVVRGTHGHQIVRGLAGADARGRIRHGQVSVRQSAMFAFSWRAEAPMVRCALGTMLSSVSTVMISEVVHLCS